jgi:glycosyltransferase involved in cell wall biosynthesis
MKRLLIVSPIFPTRQDPTHGIFIHQMVSHLLHYFEIKVVAPLAWHKRGKLAFQDTIDGIETEYPGYFMIPKIGRSFYGFFYAFSLSRFFKKMFRRFSWDAMIVNWAYPDAFGMVLINRFFKRPLFVYVLGTDINHYTNFFFRRWMITYALKKATKVFSVADQLREKMVSLGVDPDHIVVIPRGVNTNIFYPMDKIQCREKLELPVHKKIILFTGGLLPVKGLSYFVEAALLLLKQRKDLIFLMVGEGSERENLQTLIAQGGAKETILLLGSKLHSEMPLWMGSCDLFCLPSLSEGRPNVVSEALACGRPVVGTDVGDVSRLVLQGTGGGFVVPPANSPALAEAMGRALDQDWDPKQLATLVQESTWEGSSQKIVAEVMRHLVS